MLQIAIFRPIQKIIYDGKMPPTKTALGETTDMTTDQYREARVDAAAGAAALFHSPRLDPVFAPYGIFVLRVAIGIDWIVHARLKTWRGMYTHEALLAKNGITSLLAWPTFSELMLAGSGAFALQGRRR
jgi:hypothetical protein